MSSQDWIVDPGTKRDVRFSKSENRWVDRKGRPASSPYSGHQRAAGTSSSARHDSSAATRPDARRDSRISADTRTATRALQRVRIQDPPSSSVASTDSNTDDESESGTVPRASSGMREFTMRDDKTGIVTPWQIFPPGQYTNPEDPSQKRSFSFKRIGKRDDGGQDRKTKSRNISDKPEEDYQPGNVVEVKHVPPPRGATSVVSSFERADTPSPAAFKQRYIIVEQRPGGRNSFKVIPINIYFDEGVGREGIIKSHHGQCYVGRDVPKIRSGEHPRRLPDGRFESGMQPTAIRLQPFDRKKSIDPLSRIDYFDDFLEVDYEWEYIKLFGNVHKDSRAAFFHQYRSVKHTVNAISRGPSAPRDTSRTQTQTSQTTRDGPSSSGTARAPPSPTQYSQGTAARHRPAPTEQGSTGTTSLPSSSSAGVMTVSDLQRRLETLRAYARSNSLTVPAGKITDIELRGLAANPDQCKRYLDTIVARFKQELDARDSSSSSQSD